MTAAWILGLLESYPAECLLVFALVVVGFGIYRIISAGPRRWK